MRWRRVLTFTVVMAVGMGCCPETWREGGTIDRAMAKDIQEELHRHDCPLSKEEWLEKCEDPAQWAWRFMARTACGPHRKCRHYLETRPWTCGPEV